MVNFMIPALGVAALTSFSMAAPGARIPMELAQRDSSFSFTQWVEDKIKDPEGANLTPEEAWAKAQNAERDVGNALNKRDPLCNTKDVASAPDAVWCIDYLSSLGEAPCDVAYGGATNLCTHGNAQIVGVTNQQGGTSSYCQDVARALGGIMDICWRADNTVQGEDYAWGNGNMAVHISAPLI